MRKPDAVLPLWQPTCALPLLPPLPLTVAARLLEEQLRLPLLPPRLPLLQLLLLGLPAQHPALPLHPLATPLLLVQWRWWLHAPEAAAAVAVAAGASHSGCRETARG